MEIKKSELKGKNFWIFFAIFLLFYYFGDSLFLYLSMRLTFENLEPFVTFLFNPNALFFGSILTFFTLNLITKRLISEKPNKVFYIEFPILIFVIFLLNIISLSLGIIIMIGERVTQRDVLSIIFIPMVFRIVWVLVLIFFLRLYKYFNKNNF